MQLDALSPLDGRYREKVAELRPIMSEFGLMHYRLIVEVRWLIFLSQEEAITELPPLDAANLSALNQLIEQFSNDDAAAIKKIEQTTNHDVKAVEYFLQEKLKHAPELIPFIHFSCTSEDINNVAYALMQKTALSQVILPQLDAIHTALQEKAKPMLNSPCSLEHTVKAQARPP